MSVSIKELRGIDEETLHKQIDFTGADDELLSAVATHDETIYGVYGAEKLVGVVQIKTGKSVSVTFSSIRRCAGAELGVPYWLCVRRGCVSTAQSKS